VKFVTTTVIFYQELTLTIRLHLPKWNAGSGMKLEHGVQSQMEKRFNAFFTRANDYAFEARPPTASLRF